jgi:hypothetical protein
MEDFKEEARKTYQQKLDEWTTPDALLKDLKRAEDFWKAVKLIPVPTIDAADIARAEQKLLDLGIPTPFPAIDPQDKTGIITIREAIQKMTEYEDNIVGALVQSRTELALELIGMPEKFLLTVVTIAQDFIDWLLGNSRSATPYWRVLLQAIGAAFFLLTIGPAIATTKILFGPLLAETWDPLYNSRMFQFFGPRKRRVTRARIGRQLQ